MMQFIVTLGKSPFGYERIAVPVAGVTRLNQAFREANYTIFLTVETNALRYRIDGGDPGAVEGHLVQPGQSLYFEDAKSVRALRMRAIGGAADVRVTYYR